MSEPDPSFGNTASPDSQIVTADSLSYWSSISADVNGMLGGFPQVSRIDLQGSKNFIAKVRRLNSKSTASPSETASESSIQDQSSSKKIHLCVDCGAGIGRITSGLLTQVCDIVDVVEPIDKFASVIASSPLRQEGKVGDVYVQGLEKWQPSKKYDLIWNQWCVGHLTDTQLTDYLKRASQSLAPGGWIAVKENLSTEKFGKDIFDEVDSSVTRSDEKFKQIFEDAGLDLLRAELQTGFPKGLGLFPVKMYALKPR